MRIFTLEKFCGELAGKWHQAAHISEPYVEDKDDVDDLELYGATENEEKNILYKDTDSIANVMKEDSTLCDAVLKGFDQEQLNDLAKWVISDKTACQHLDGLLTCLVSLATFALLHLLLSNQVQFVHLSFFESSNEHFLIRNKRC